MIIIEPASGLANRMRVVASAMSVVNIAKEQIKLVDCNFRFKLRV